MHDYSVPFWSLLITLEPIPLLAVSLLEPSPIRSRRPSESHASLLCQTPGVITRYRTYLFVWWSLHVTYTAVAYYRGLLREHSSYFILQYQFANEVHWHCHPLQQFGECTCVEWVWSQQESKKVWSLNRKGCGHTMVVASLLSFFVCTACVLYVYLSSCLCGLVPLLHCRVKVRWVWCGGFFVARSWGCVGLSVGSCPGKSCPTSSSTGTLRRWGRELTLGYWQMWQ